MEYLASLGDMTKKQLEDILMNYNQQRYMEQMQQQQGGQAARQADAYLTGNLSKNQLGLAVEMNRVFNLMQYLKRSDTDNNPAAKDSLSKKLDSLLKANTDTNKLKQKPDSSKNKLASIIKNKKTFYLGGGGFFIVVFINKIKS
jgi:hypothetical protein